MNTCVYIPLKRIANLFEDLCNFNLDRKFEIFFLLEQEFLIEKFLFLLFEEFLKRFFRKLEQRQNFPNLELPRWTEFMRVGFENLHNNYETTRTTKICMLLLRVDVFLFFVSRGCVVSDTIKITMGFLYFRLRKQRFRNLSPKIGFISRFPTDHSRERPLFVRYHKRGQLQWKHRWIKHIC